MRLICEVVVNVPTPIGGVVAAVGLWATSRAGKMVALPAKGRLAAVVTMLLEDKCRSPNIDFGDAVRALLAARVWTLVGDWACGVRGTLRNTVADLQQRPPTTASGLAQTEPAQEAQAAPRVS